MNDAFALDLISQKIGQNECNKNKKNRQVEKGVDFSTNSRKNYHYLVRETKPG